MSKLSQYDGRVYEPPYNSSHDAVIKNEAIISKLTAALQLAQEALEAAAKQLESQRNQNTRSFVRSAIIEVKAAIQLGYKS